MRLITTAFLALTVASPVFANGGGGHGKKSDSGKSNRIKAEWKVKNDAIPEYKVPDQAQSLHSVDIPVVVAPIAINGHLVNYAFLSIRVVLKDNVDAWEMRTNAHFMRDAVLRAAHENPFGKSGEISLLDEGRTLKMVQSVIRPWVSDEQIDHIELLSVDMLNG